MYFPCRFIFYTHASSSFIIIIYNSQGWAADFIPKLVDKATKEKVYDNILHCGGNEAIETCKELARKEGIFSGTSGGGVLCSALKLAEKSAEGTSILALIADTGER